MTNEYYSAEELEFIRAKWEFTSPTELGQILSRSTNSIYSIGRRLGLPLKGNPRKWSHERLRLLMEQYDTAVRVDLLAAINALAGKPISLRSMVAMACSLGFSRCNSRHCQQGISPRALQAAPELAPPVVMLPYRKQPQVVGKHGPSNWAVEHDLPHDAPLSVINMARAKRKLPPLVVMG